MASGLLLDASVFIAAEVGRPLRRRPEGEARVSVVTLAELQLGVLRSDGPVRELREATLGTARRFLSMPIDEHVAEELAGLLARLRAAQRRAKAFDCFVAALGALPPRDGPLHGCAAQCGAARGVRGGDTGRDRARCGRLARV